MKKQFINLSLFLAILLLAGPVLAEELVGASTTKNSVNPIRAEIRDDVEELRENSLKEQEKIREESKERQELLIETTKTEQEKLREDIKNEQETWRGQAEQVRENTKTKLEAAAGDPDEIKQIREDLDDDREILREANQIRQEDLKARAEKIREEAKQQAEKNREELKNQREELHSQTITALQKVLELAKGSSTTAIRLQNAVQTQAQNQEKIATNLEKIQEQNRFAKFFFGPKIKDTEALKNTLESNEFQIKELESTKLELESADEVQILDEQIKVLEETNIINAAAVENAQKSFSLFGWVNRMFRK